MSSPRWQHLDRHKSPPIVSPAPPSEGPEAPPPVSAAGESPIDPPSDHPALRAARGYYHLRQFQACVEAVEAALEAEPALPGAQRLLGLALGRVGEPARAVEALARGCDEDPSDMDLHASLASAQMGLGAIPRSLPHLPGR
ncbi:MAG TPA: hypothetical protein VK689_19975, partial [Armatimonadota bacterium]|nr:hypothetical protein [Armatimonadota bacterium]